MSSDDYLVVRFVHADIMFILNKINITTNKIKCKRVKK